MMKYIKELRMKIDFDTFFFWAIVIGVIGMVGVFVAMLFSIKFYGYIYTALAFGLIFNLVGGKRSSLIYGVILLIFHISLKHYNII